MALPLEAWYCPNTGLTKLCLVIYVFGLCISHLTFYMDFFPSYVPRKLIIQSEGNERPCHLSAGLIECQHIPDRT